MDYDAVVITAKVFTAEAAMDQPEAVSLSSMWQNTASAGALDTDTPFLLRGNRVYLPMGGDWVLTEQPQEGAPG